MFLKLMLRIVEVLSNVLTLISQVAALNWSDTIYPNLGYPRQKRRKSTFLHQRWSESILSISDVLETYVDISWGPKQRFGINQPSGRAQLKSHHIPKLRVPLSNRRKSNFLHEKLSESILFISDVPENYVENSWGPQQRFGINQPSGRAQLMSHHIPKLRVPPSKRRKSTFLNEKLSESILSISDVPENYVRNSWGPKQRFGINQPSGRAQLKSHHIPKLWVPWSKTPKIVIFAQKVIWKYFIH